MPNYYKVEAVKKIIKKSFGFFATGNNKELFMPLGDDPYTKTDNLELIVRENPFYTLLMGAFVDQNGEELVVMERHSHKAEKYSKLYEAHFGSKPIIKILKRGEELNFFQKDSFKPIESDKENLRIFEELRNLRDFDSSELINPEKNSLVMATYEYDDNLQKFSNDKKGKTIFPLWWQAYSSPPAYSNPKDLEDELNHMRRQIKEGGEEGKNLFFIKDLRCPINSFIRISKESLRDQRKKLSKKMRARLENKALETRFNSREYKSIHDLIDYATEKAHIITRLDLSTDKRIVNDFEELINFEIITPTKKMPYSSFKPMVEEVFEKIDFKFPETLINEAYSKTESIYDGSRQIADWFKKMVEQPDITINSPYFKKQKTLM